MKLNLACGRDIKEGFINVDRNDPEGRLDVVMDLRRKFPWEIESIDYIYVEQFLEHLNWVEGQNFLLNCYHVLKTEGTLRLVIPDYKKIFMCYLNHDYTFFDVFRKSLNENDYPYYYNMFYYPENVDRKQRERAPKWHRSIMPQDRKRLRERAKHFDHHIEIVNWFTHQFSEHKALYDFDSLSGLLMDIGFTYVKKTEIKDIDSHEPTRITCSLYVEATK